jgi:erythromycin esterase
MFKFRRAYCVILPYVLLPASGAAQRTPQDLSADPRIAWLRENVLPIRTIDPEEDDFTDLEPLRAILEDVRLVLLGEADHGSGSDFLAKTRLVKFLHRELGFDVLAFEAPMYDVAVAWDSLRMGMPARDALLLGPGTWAGWVQMQPLVGYLGEQAQGRQPLEIAGFDHQHQLASAFYFVEDLAGFLSDRGLGGPLLDPDSPERGVLQALAQVLYRYGLAPRPDSSTAQAFLQAIEKSLVAASAMPDEQARQWTQALRSLSCHWRWVLRQPDIASCDRDRQMAENVVWLANERYPDHKIIVWTATAHAVRVPRMSDVGVPDRDGGSEPSMGQHLREAFGPKSYAIGMTSYVGKSGRPDREIIADQDSLPEFEELMVAAGFDHGFLDLRRAAAEGSWVGDEFPARPVGHTTYSAVWSDVLDALLFIREQQPGQRVAPPSIDIEAINDVRELASAAFLEGDADSYVALFTDDCLVMPSTGSRIRGHTALRSWLEAVHGQFAFAGGRPEALGIEVVDGWAWEIYTAGRTRTPTGGGEVVEEQFVGMRLYRRQPDGMWRIAQDTWNTATPRGGS